MSYSIPTPILGPIDWLEHLTELRFAIYQTSHVLAIAWIWLSTSYHGRKAHLSDRWTGGLEFYSIAPDKECSFDINHCPPKHLHGGETGE